METDVSENSECSEVQEEVDENSIYCSRCEKTVELQDFISENKVLIQKITKESKFSMSKKATTNHDQVLNIISSKLKIKDANDDLIYELYRNLRNKNYPKEEMEVLLQDAHKNAFEGFHSLRSFQCKNKTIEMQ